MLPPMIPIRQLRPTTKAADSSLLPYFVTAYSESAHGCFLLAVLQAASIYHNDVGSVAVAAVVTAWRWLVSLASFVYIVTTTRTIPVASIFFTVTECLTMIPILAASLHLLRRACFPSDNTNYIHVDDNNNNGNSDDDKSDVESDNKMQIVVVELENDGLMKQRQEKECSRVPGSNTSIVRFRCTTVSQIAASGRYTPRQKRGARALSFGSIGLLIGLTLESVLLLSQSLVGSNFSHDIYKWGMHVSVMYLFCCHMSVEPVTLYRTCTRPLLALACPVGALLALWQLSILFQTGAQDDDDPWSVTVGFLFVFRAACQLLQTVGVFLLNDAEPSVDDAIPQFQVKFRRRMIGCCTRLD